MVVAEKTIEQNDDTIVNGWKLCHKDTDGDIEEVDSIVSGEYILVYQEEMAPAKDFFIIN